MKWLKENGWPITIALLIVGFFAMVVGGAVKIENEKDEVKSNCPRTDLVVLGGKNGTPRWVYDCTGVEKLKGLKR